MKKTQSKTNSQVANHTKSSSGEGGIRTRGTVLPVRRFSKAVLSTTQPPLRREYPITRLGLRQARPQEADAVLDVLESLRLRADFAFDAERSAEADGL